MGRLIAAPTELSGCILWLDAQDFASITQDGSNLVSQWNDKSGNANHATQATAGNRATYAAAGWNGLPCIDYGASGTKGYETPSVSFGAHTLFVVFRGDASSNYLVVHNDDSVVNGSYFFCHNNSSSVVARASVRSGKNYASGWGRDGVRKCACRSFVATHGDHRLFINGLLTTAPDGSFVSDPGAVANTGKLYIGCQQTTTTGLRGVFAEILLFNRCLSDGERFLVEQYLMRKWALYPPRLINSPLEINDCGMWYEASAGNITSAAGLVSQWSDASGNARHLVQASDPLKPTYNAANAAYGGRPTVDWLTASVGTRLDRGAETLTKPLTIFACCNLSNTNSAQCGLFDNATSSEFAFYRTSAGLFEWFPFGNTLTFPAVAPVGTKPFILSITSIVGENRINVNGVTMARGSAASASAITNFRLGSFVLAAQGLNWTGSIAEFLVYRRQLSDGEVAMVETYLRRKYSL